MSSLRIPLALLLLTLAGSASIVRAADGSLFSFYDGWGPVIVTTEFTAAGKALLPPTTTQPAYYRGASAVLVGTLPGDKEPEPRELTRLVASILAKQGYLAAAPEKREPSLFLVVQWGYLRPEFDDVRWFLCGERRNELTDDPLFSENLRLRGIELANRDARYPIYGIAITAYDPKTAHSPQPIVYWQTRIGLPANGKYMAQALPVMVASAGLVIGRPAGNPALLDTDAARAGRVRLGELEFLDYLSEAPPFDTANWSRGSLYRLGEITPALAQSEKK